MLFRSFARIACLGASLLLAAGCTESNAKKSKPPNSTPATTDSAKKGDNHADHDHDSGHGHSHVRGKMMIADAGPYHVLLTAHLAKTGNELDIFFETPDDKNPQPQPVPIESFEAQATAGEGESQTLKFEPAPAEERPAGEKPGTFSHFVAKAPWMKPEQDLLVVAKFTVGGKEHVARWKDFNPKNFAHHVE